MNNLRQLQVAWRTYIEDNDDFMPFNRSTPTVNERLLGRRNSSNSWVVGSPKEDVSSGNIVKGKDHEWVWLKPDERRALKAWIDLNCPLWPDYTCRPERPL